MQLYCPSCQATYSAASRCPQCGDRLVTPAEAFAAIPDHVPPPPTLLRPTAGSRIAVGCVLAIGLYLGLREWAGAAFPDDGWWASTAGVAVTVCLRALGVLVGGLLAGAGRERGVTTGSAVGLVCGGLYLIADGVTGADLLAADGVVWAGLAVLAAAVGLIGSRVWPPPVDLPDHVPVQRSSSLVRLAEEGKKARAPRPTAWARVLLGVVLAVSGVATADTARSGLKKASAGMLNLGGPAHAPLVDLQLAALAIGLAGAVAGANTGAGLRHGLIVGLLAGGGVVGLAAAGMETVYPVTEGLLRMLGLPATDLAGGPAMIAVMLAVAGGCAAGGWFGGQLLPPLAPSWMRTKLVPVS